MTNEASIAALLKLLRERSSFVITSHMRPDGDAIGSSLGMMHLLEAMGKRATVAFADPIPGVFDCLPGVEKIVHELPTGPVDAFIPLECDRIERSGFTQQQADAMQAGMVINIDHHLSGRAFGSFNWIDSKACAVGAMIYDLAVASGIKISEGMAKCLYAAVLTDTGSFNYASTTSSTFGMAAHLVEMGVNANEMAQAIYFNNPVSKVRLLGRVLSKINFEGSFAWSCITLEDMAASGATLEDCEGVVNNLISIAGVEVALLLRESLPNAQYRLSMRSKGDLDVARIAESFGGGGHRNASGGTLDGTLEYAVAKVLHAVNVGTAALHGRGAGLHGVAAETPSQAQTLLA